MPAGGGDKQEAGDGEMYREAGSCVQNPEVRAAGGTLVLSEKVSTYTRTVVRCTGVGMRA